MLDVTKTAQRGQVLPVVSDGKSVVSRRAANWFREHVARAQHGVFTDIVTLTPERAEMLLSVNADNRVVSAKHVELLASDMIEGRWEINGESIKVSSDGALNDGQHRCAAVVSSGVSIETAITWGVSRDSRTTLDQGRVRGVGDYIVMAPDARSAYSNEKAAAARQMLMLRLGMRDGWASKITKSAVLQEFYSIQDELNWAAEVVCGTNPRAPGGSTANIVACILIGRIDRGAAAAFIDKLKLGADLSAKSPILYARERLKSGERMGAQDKIELLIRAYNLSRRGGHRGLPRIPLSGNIPNVVG